MKNKHVDFHGCNSSVPHWNCAHMKTNTRIWTKFALSFCYRLHKLKEGAVPMTLTRFPRFSCIVILAASCCGIKRWRKLRKLTTTKNQIENYKNVLNLQSQNWKLFRICWNFEWLNCFLVEQMFLFVDFLLLGCRRISKPFFHQTGLFKEFCSHFRYKHPTKSYTLKQEKRRRMCKHCNDLNEVKWSNGETIENQETNVKILWNEKHSENLEMLARYKSKTWNYCKIVIVYNTF